MGEVRMQKRANASISTRCDLHFDLFMKIG